MYASRNGNLCTKDCLCLFVCPTGATDTEDGQIDKSRCLDGCRLCVDACPSHAIYLVFEKYPEPAPKDPEVTTALMNLCEAKFGEEDTSLSIAEYTENSIEARIARALQRSTRILAEDCAREGGYMTPDCKPTKELLAQFPDSQAARKLLELLR